MPEGRRGKRKNGAPRTMCQHYRTETFYDAAGRATLETCTDCGITLSSAKVKS